jgi:hypothetical protein
MQLDFDQLTFKCECGRKAEPDKHGWVECVCGDVRPFECYLIKYGFHPDYQDEAKKPF